MAEAANVTDDHLSITGKPSEDSVFDEGTVTFVKNVLRQSHRTILKDLKPDDVLDVFTEEEVFGENTVIQVRDIKEQKETTEKNRRICDIFRRRPNLYVSLKRALVRSGQTGLLEIIENTEKKVHPQQTGDLLGCSCSDAGSSCRFLESLKCPKDLPHVESSQQKDLRKFLMDRYKANFQAIPIPGVKCSVNEIYVSRELKVVDNCGNPKKSDKLNKQRGSRKDERGTESIATIRDIFYTDENPCNNVYVSGEAGLGKSIFCEHLVKLWCDAHSETDTDNIDFTRDKDLQTMSEFKLLFFINLRKVKLSDEASSNEIAELIYNQLSLKFKGYSQDDVEECLCNTRTLVLMDSLDESNLTRLPLRSFSNKSCILTTSRPWKLEAIRIESRSNTNQPIAMQVDKQIEIVGLGENSKKKLVENVLKVLKKEIDILDSDNSKSSNGFISDMISHGLSESLDSPMMIIQMIVPWHDGDLIKGSQYDIYSKLVHHQLITAKNLPGCQEKTATVTFPIACDKTNCRCLSYGELMLKVTKLAYYALFGKEGEMSLVFDEKACKEHGLSENDVTNCLKIGFLTELRVFDGRILPKKQSVRFLHKTNQEFFAAIYLSGNQQEMELVKSYVNNDLFRALELDKVFMFCSQSNQTVTRQLSRLIYDIADRDPRVQEYRQSGEYDYAPNQDLIYKIQNIVSAAVEQSIKISSSPQNALISSTQQAAEAPTPITQNRSGSTPKLIMADIILGEPQWRRTDRRLVEALDMAELKSVRINAEYADVTIWKLLEQETRSLQSLVVGKGEKRNVENIHGVVVRNLTTLRTLGLEGEWRLLDLSGLGNKVSVMLTCDLTCLLLDCVELSHEQCVMLVQRLSEKQNLQQLTLSHMTFSHKQCEMLVQRLSEKQNLQRLTLEWITCLTHGMYRGECCDVKLQSKLEHVTLVRLPFRDVSFHTVDLKTCEIWLDNVPAATSALSCLTSASNLRKFTCGSLDDVASVQKLVAVLPRLHGLQRIFLGSIDFGSEREIRLSAAAKTLESVELRDSTITADGLESLVESVKAPRVEITLGGVTIRDRDPRDFLQRLRESPDYEVTEDRGVKYQKWWGRWWVVEFVFYKNK